MPFRIGDAIVYFVVLSETRDFQDRFTASIDINTNTHYLYSPGYLAATVGLTQVRPNSTGYRSGQAFLGTVVASAHVWNSSIGCLGISLTQST